MKPLLPAALLLALTSQTFALSLAPGQSGNANGLGIPSSGTTLNSLNIPFTERLSDVGIPDTLHTTVTLTPSDQMIFTYQLTPNDLATVTLPHLLNLNGFKNVSTDIYVLADPASPATNFLASRSADGSTLSLQTYPLNPLADQTAPSLTVEILTNSTTFNLNPEAYEPVYWVSPFPPPGQPGTPFIDGFPTLAFSPNSPIPEPLSLLTLPLAVLALTFKNRRRT